MQTLPSETEHYHQHTIQTGRIIYAVKSDVDGEFLRQDGAKGSLAKRIKKYFQAMVNKMKSLEQKLIQMKENYMISKTILEDAISVKLFDVKIIKQNS